MRLTKIVCTLGPASNSEAGIRALVREGMNVARLNFSHGSPEEHRALIRRIRLLDETERWNLAILLDTKGAEIRTGDRPEPLKISAGQEVLFTQKGSDATHAVITVNYPDFWKDVADADCILVDNGEIIFDVVSVLEDRVLARARDDGSIGSRRHVNLPGADVSLPSITEKDWEDIRLACTEKLDFIALSFIRTAAEVEEVRAFTKKEGHEDVRLISKIENAAAVRNIAEIVAASDGIMIARGDLGAEVPVERVPAIQDEIVERCRAAGKPVIVATHMLESMIKNPLPTRAEVMDIAHAAVTRADATMLSGETAAGKHPFAAISVMSRVLEQTESTLPSQHSVVIPGGKRSDALAAAAVSMARSVGASAIVAFTRSSNTARAVSRLRPHVPVFALSDRHEALRRTQLMFGVTPVEFPIDNLPVPPVAEALDLLKERSLLRSGDHVVVICTMMEDERIVRTVQLRAIL